MGGGSSRRLNNNIGPVGPVGGPRALGPGRAPIAPRYIPFPAPAPACPAPCPPRVVSFPPQVRFLPPLPPRIVQLPPKCLPIPTPVRCCLPPPPPIQCCPLPPPPCQPCLPAPPVLRCLPAPLPGIPCVPQPYAQLPCLPGIPQHQIIQRQYAPAQQYHVVPQQQVAYPQPVQQYLPVAPQAQYLTAPRSVAVARPVDNALLPSRQIEYVPTPVKQIDYAPPATLSNRQIAYSGKISRRSDYDDFDDVAGVRPEGVAVDGSARSGSRLEYYGENASRAQSGIEYQPQAVEAAPAPAQQTVLESAPRASVQYRRVSQLPEGTLADAPGTASGALSVLSQAAAAADQAVQYRAIQNATTPAQTRGSLTAASLYSTVQAPAPAQNATPTPSNQAPSYRIITQQPDGTTTIREGTTLPSGLQYRVVQSATPSQQYRLAADEAAAAEAELAANASQDEYVEAVSDDGVHYRPVTSQPILTNIKLAKTLTQQSGRPLSALQQYILNNNSNLSNINELNNNTYSIARSIATLSQQQQQQDQQEQQQQQQDQEPEMIEIPVNVPVKVRIPAPNAANKQQIYNTTIECRQKPYCPERDGSITSN